MDNLLHWDFYFATEMIATFYESCIKLRKKRNESAQLNFVGIVKCSRTKFLVLHSSKMVQRPLGLSVPPLPPASIVPLDKFNYSDDGGLADRR